MLKLQDTVFAKTGEGDKKKIFSQNYERVYFTHGTGDKVKTADKQFDGAKAGTSIVPDGKSAHSVDTLWNEMVSYLSTENPKVEDIRTSIIDLVEKATDLTKRANIGATLRPKEIDVDKKMESTAKSLVQLGVYKTYEEALAKLKEQMTVAA